MIVAVDTEMVELLAAFEELERCLIQIGDRVDLISRRTDFIRRQRAGGEAWEKIVLAAERPLIVELVATSISDLHEASGQLRRAEAKALHDGTLTMAAIAALFGVSRQRVSLLLRADGKAAPRRPS
jgi:hypothetical protein